MSMINLFKKNLKEQKVQHEKIKSVFVGDYLLFNNGMIGKIVYVNYHTIKVSIEINKNVFLEINLLHTLIMHPLDYLRWRYNLQDLKVVQKIITLKDKLDLL